MTSMYKYHESAKFANPMVMPIGINLSPVVGFLKWAWPDGTQRSPQHRDAKTWHISQLYWIGNHDGH